MKIQKILGLDERAWHLSPTSIKKSYRNIGYALIFVSIISIATGVELTSQFTDVMPILIFGGLTYGALIFCVDYFLVSGESTTFSFITRAVFGSSNVVLGVVSFLLLINTNDINNYNKATINAQLNSLSDKYIKEKTNRYRVANEKDSTIASYHLANCVKEASVVYAGPQYDKIHNSFCLPEESKLTKLKIELDVAEVVFNTIYEEKKVVLRDVFRLGLFEKVDILFKKIILPNPYKIGFAILLFVFLLGMEFTAMFAKLNIKKDNNYTKLKNQIEKGDVEIAGEELDNNHEVQKIKLKNNNALLKTEIRLDNKVTQYLLVQRMKNEFLKAKAISPELWSDSLVKECNKIFEDEAYVLSENLKDELNIEVVENVTTDNHKDTPNVNLFNTFYLTLPMKQLADGLRLESKNNMSKFTERLFDWSIKNLSFDMTHNLSHYKNAREVFNSKQGVCGELAIFFNAMCKYVSIETDYVHVDVDFNGQKVNHACSGVNLKNNYLLIDISYKTFNAPHRQWSPISNVELMQNLTQWNS